MRCAGPFALLLLGCTSTTPPTPSDTGPAPDVVVEDVSADTPTDASSVDVDAVSVVDVSSGDVQRICPVVARAGEVCGELEGLVCTGTRVCTQCGVFAYEYFEQQCVCRAGMWQCGGHSDCGPSARCGYFSDPMCMSPHPCGDGGVDASATDVGADVVDATDSVADVVDATTVE